MLNLSIKEQKVVVGGYKVRVIVYDHKDRKVAKKYFPNWEEAQAWAKIATHKGEDGYYAKIREFY